MIKANFLGCVLLNLLHSFFLKPCLFAWRLSCERGRCAWEWNWARCFQLACLWLLVRSKCCSVSEPVSVMQFCFSSRNSIRCIYMSPWVKAPELGRAAPATSSTVKWLQFCFWTWNEILVLYQCCVLIPYKSSWYGSSDMKT